MAASIKLLLDDGALTATWSPDLAEAINQAHFELDFVSEEFDFETEAGLASGGTYHRNGDRLAMEFWRDG